MRKYFLWILGLIFICGCSPVSQKDFEMEGKSLAKSLLKDLQSVKNTDDLNKLRSRLEDTYIQVADLMIESTKQGTSVNPYEDLDTSISDQLLQEYRRIYQIPDGRKIMEEIQSRGLTRLDRFNRDLLK